MQNRQTEEVVTYMREVETVQRERIMVDYAESVHPDLARLMRKIYAIRRRRGLRVIENN